MTHLQAQDTVRSAIDNLISVRDTLGATLAEAQCRSGSGSRTANDDIRRLSEIHDRVARTVASYQKG